MEVDLRRTHRCVSQQFGHLIEPAASIDDVAAKGMPELMG
jgi:hypothetical protein